jgi:RND family efflux transporter MFP subunit
VRRGLYIFFALAAAVVAVSALLIVRARGIEVEVAKVERGPAVDLVYATGFVEPQQPVLVSSRLTAPVRRVLVKEGDRVANGQPLVLLDDAEQRGLLAQAQAEAQNAALSEQRISKLYQQGWTTKAAYDQAVAADKAAKASVDTLKARVDQTVVRAGISGVVLKQDVYPGDLAVPGKELLQLGDPGLARVTATVDERDITRVRIGQEALMSSEALDQIVHGRVTEITPTGDPSQRAFRVRIGLAKGDKLPFGLTLEVNIVTGRHDNALLVPASAIADDHVFVVEDGRARARKIKEGIAGPDKAEVLSGVKQGEAVVVSPPETLEDGDKVRR